MTIHVDCTCWTQSMLIRRHGGHITCWSEDMLMTRRVDHNTCWSHKDMFITRQVELKICFGLYHERIVHFATLVQSRSNIQKVVDKLAGSTSFQNKPRRYVWWQTDWEWGWRCRQGFTCTGISVVPTVICMRNTRTLVCLQVLPRPSALLTACLTCQHNSSLQKAAIEPIHTPWMWNTLYHHLFTIWG